jgi:hypothetical protein
MRIINAIILLFISLNSFSQIKVVGGKEEWGKSIDQALILVKENDTASYNIIIQNCKNIDFIIGDVSTTSPPHTIVINTKDFDLNSVNNIACILVHESYHLYIYNHGIKLTEKQEELICYKREYSFLCKLQNAEYWLFLHTIKQIISLENRPN